MNGVPEKASSPPNEGKPKRNVRRRVSVTEEVLSHSKTDDERSLSYWLSHKNRWIRHFFNPLSKLRHQFEVFVAVIVFVECLFVPFFATFNIASIDQLAFLAFSYFVDIINTVKICANMRTAIYIPETATFITNPRILSKKYRSTSTFYVDVAGTIPIELLSLLAGLPLQGH
jgi:TRAP-type mannitol/chloroaromatic compound transport system permease large subunit